MIDSYYDGKDLIEADNGNPNFNRISPSSVSRFFAHPRQWWGENFLDEPGFEGSTATVLGTIIHHFAEIAGRKLPAPADPDQEVEDYLASITFDIDRDLIRQNWRDMTTILIDNQVKGKQFHSVEEYIFTPLLPGIYVGGTYDALLPVGDGTYILRDYKTTATKPSGISYDYRMQLHTYAHILRQRGIPISYIELCFAVRPTKTLPAREFSFREPITEDDYSKIASQLMTVAESIKLWNEQPELRWALAQDLRLKEKPKPTLFKD